MSIIREDTQHGFPWGAYDVSYYRIRPSGRVQRLIGCDRNVSHTSVERSIRELEADEVLQAVCVSSAAGGGCVAAGSQVAMDAWDRETAEEERR
jgi:hypothetical protein